MEESIQLLSELFDTDEYDDHMLLNLETGEKSIVSLFSKDEFVRAKFQNCVKTLQNSLLSKEGLIKIKNIKQLAEKGYEIKFRQSEKMSRVIMIEVSKNNKKLTMPIPLNNANYYML